MDLEDYVRGVVSKESPASWPPEALKAQAVAARSFALSTGARGSSFDVFDDTRSQAYGGVGAETAKTDQAVRATQLQVVLYAGRVAQTFYFSTSGGHTENNELSSLGFGQPPIPYLRDPLDVQLWFGKIERDLLARGIFTSIPDLARKIRRYITRYNEDPKPIRWTYSNPANRITTDSADTVH